MKFLLRIIPPITLGIIEFSAIRLVTDPSRGDEWWPSYPGGHLKAILLTILFSILFDVYCRKYFRSYVFGKNTSVIVEYLTISTTLILSLNFLVVLLYISGIIEMGRPVSDFIILNLVYIPLDILYYTLLRNSEYADYYNTQTIRFLNIEMQLLKARFQPHFLFNALNTVYCLINEKESDARKSLEQLSDLLRYSLYETNEKVSLRRDWEMLVSYTNFQMRRKPERLKVSIDYHEPLGTITLYPLLFQPLVENAFKYVGGRYSIDISLQVDADRLVFKVYNSLPEHNIASKITNGGTGIENLRKRLALLYPHTSRLELEKHTDSFTSTLTLDLKS